MRIFSIATILCVFVGAVACPPPQSSTAPPPITGPNVRLHSTLDSNNVQYRVEGAEGRDAREASGRAMVAALIYASKRLTGDPQQKTNAGYYVQRHVRAMLAFATGGEIFRRSFSADGSMIKINMFVKINKTALQRKLVECRVITSSRQLAAGAGKPKIMVMFDMSDCKRGNTRGPLCTLPKQIKKLRVLVKREERKVRAYENRIIKAGCLDKEKFKGGYSVSSRSSYGYAGVSSWYGGYSVSRGSRQYRAKAFYQAVKPSRHCRAFMNRLRTMERKVDYWWIKAELKINRIDRLRARYLKDAVTTVKINEWFLNQRWEVVDKDAVKQARSTQDSIQSVAGLPRDKVAQLALFAGADIYVMHGYTTSRPGGGFKVELNVKAYEVVSGKLLASKTGSSNTLESAEQKPQAVSQAVGRVMPQILQQITGYWADMSREGVKTKIILRGRFGATRVRFKVTNALDSISQMGTFKSRCGGKCVWTRKLQTGATIMGEYNSTAWLRTRLGDFVAHAFEKAGFRKVRQIISNNSLLIIQLR